MLKHIKTFLLQSLEDHKKGFIDKQQAVTTLKKEREKLSARINKNDFSAKNSLCFEPYWERTPLRINGVESADNINKNTDSLFLIGNINSDSQIHQFKEVINIPLRKEVVKLNGKAQGIDSDYCGLLEEKAITHAINSSEGASYTVLIKLDDVDMGRGIGTDVNAGEGSSAIGFFGVLLSLAKTLLDNKFIKPVNIILAYGEQNAAASVVSMRL